MKLLKQLGVGKKEFDYQRESDEFKAHFDRLFERVMTHIQETQDGAAFEAMTGALLHIHDRVDAFNKLVAAVKTLEASGG